MLELIVKGMAKDQEIYDMEKSLGIPSLLGKLQHFKQIRNELAHDDPFLDPKELSLEYLELIEGGMKNELEKQLEGILQKDPELTQPMEWIKKVIMDIMTTMSQIKILGLMLMGYPSLIEKLLENRKSLPLSVS